MLLREVLFTGLELMNASNTSHAYTLCLEKRPTFDLL